MRKNKKYFYSIACVFMAVLMIMLSVSLPVSALSDKKETNENKIDFALKEKMATASPDEKIPVAIWYEDVDQEQIDTLTAQKVGFSEDNVAVAYEMPSTELLRSLEAEEVGAVDEMQAYLERTEKQREKESKRTDEYIMTRREFSREKYNEKSAKVIKDIDLEENDIVFKSQYAPMIITNITGKEINNCASSKNINMLQYYEEPETVIASSTDATYANSAKITTNYTKLVDKLGFSGEDVSIGMVDAGYPAACDDLNASQIIQFGNIPQDSDHAASMDKILISTNFGYAKDATVCVTDINLANIESMISSQYNVKILCFVSVWSFNDYDGDEYAYSTIDKWADHLVAEHNITITSASGSDHPDRRIHSPGLGYNVITVAAYSDMQTPNDYTDDRYMSYCRYINKKEGAIGIEKPDVIMPDTIENGGTCGASTSLAAILAIMFNLKPTLAIHPQAVKAIVLASCQRKVLPSTNGETAESMEQGITETQGAGAPDVWAMACIISQGTYGVGRIQGARTQATRHFIVSDTVSTAMNVSITWLRENSFPENASHGTTTGINEGDAVNLDLSVYRNGVLVGNSALEKSSTEMTYFSLNSQISNYEIRINEEEPYDDIVRYGYAYCTNNPYISPVTEEGIYYIRNYYSDKYLTLDTETNEAVMENFTGNDNQKWILRGSDNDYEIYPAYGTVAGKLNFGTQVGSNPYYKAALGAENLNLEMKSWETDTTLEPDAFVFTSKSGGSNNILSYTYSNGIFVRSNTDPVINSYRMWVMEDINFRRGDANMDGKLTPQDATLIRQHLADFEGAELNNQQLFLADANRDGRVSTNDATHIGKILSDMVLF